jgi:ABC-type glycerol-3-phosphate transport system substrate-binding protein
LDKASSRFGSFFAKSAQPFKGTTLNVFADANPQGEGVQPLVKEFEKETGIRVNYQVVSELSIIPKAEVALAAANGTLDVTWGGLSEKPAWVTAKWVDPIDHYLTDPTIFGKGFNTSDFVPACWKATEANGKHYGLPTLLDTNILMYRKDILSAQHVAIPTAVAELVAACAKVNKKPLPAIVLRGARSIHSNIWLFNIFYYAEGGSYYKGQPPGRGVPPGKLTANMGNATDLKAFETDVDCWLKGYTPTGSANFDYPETTSTFKSGKAAMLVDDVVFALEMVPALGDKVGFAPAPTGPDGMFPGFDTQMWYLAKGSRNKEAAVAFMAWTTSAAAQLATAKNGKYIGVTRDSTFRSAAFHKFVRPDVITAFKAVEPHLDINHFVQTPSFTVVGDYMSIAVNAAASGTSSPSSALAGAQRQAATYLATHQR